MNSLPKVLKVLLLIFAANTLALGQTQPDKPANTTQNGTAWKSLKDDQFEIKYPSDWTADESGMMGTHFILFSPLSGETDQFKENVNLLVQDLTGYDLTLDAYVELSENQIKTMITDGKIFLSERIKAENAAYHKVIYSGIQGEFDLKFEQFYWVRNNTAYILTLTCENDQFEAYRETGEGILHSFKIK